MHMHMHMHIRPLVYVVRILKDIDHNTLSNNLLNFHPSRGRLEVVFEIATEKGNKVKTVVWLRRVAQFPAIVRQGTSDLCGQNFKTT